MGTAAGSTRSTVQFVMAPEQPESVSAGRSSEQNEGSSLIATVISHYCPEWDAPEDDGREWISCRCPFHGDNRPSASVSYGNDAFRCFVCDATGDAIGIIMREEGIRYPEAVEYAEGLQPGSSGALRRQPAGKSGRRVFGETRATQAPSQGVRPRVRDRRTPWS